MALGSQVIDLVGLHLLEDAGQVGGIGQIPVMQDEFAVFRVGILVQMIHPFRVQQRCRMEMALGINYLQALFQKSCYFSHF